MTYEELRVLCAPYFDVSHETYLKLQKYVDLVLQEQKVQNLIATSTIETIWQRHVFDSLQLVRFIPPKANLLDLGSGAGFPGLVLALALDLPVTLVESETHKAAFLQRVAITLKCQANIWPDRVEKLVLSTKPDFITARALAPLTKLLGLAESWLTKGSVGVFPKGASWRDEIELAQKNWHFSLQSYPSLSHPEAQILVVRDLRKR